MLELFTFRISHFSEKIRWCLDASGLDYRETRWTPVIHAPEALIKGRQGTTVPILSTSRGRVQDSTRILRWLERAVPSSPILPAAGPLRDEAFALEEQLDRVGRAVIVWCYAPVIDDTDAMMQLWTPDSSAADKRILRGIFPAVRWMLRNSYGINAAGANTARTVIDETFALLDARLKAGNTYLVGDRLSFVDITACALLGPLLGPPEHAFWSQPVVRAMMAPLSREWRDRPAARWVLERYAKDRGVWRNPPPAEQGRTAGSGRTG